MNERFRLQQVNSFTVEVGTCMQSTYEQNERPVATYLLLLPLPFHYRYDPT